MEKKRNPNLDLLKLLACMAVVALHVFTFSYENVLISYLHYASGYAVPIFFMVNGYLILNKTRVDYPYVLKKILHIIIITGLWALLIFFAYLVLKREFMNPILLLLESWIQKGYLWQFWFMGAMMLTYLCAPVLHWIVHRFRKGYLVLTSGLLAMCLLVQLWILVTGESKTESLIQTFHIWKWLFYFVLGGWMKELLTELSRRLPYSIHLIIAGVLFIGFPLYQTVIGNSLNCGSYYTDPAAILCNSMLFTAVMRFPCSEKKSQAIIDCSSLGMGCYILHPIFLNVINQKIDYRLFWIPFVLYPVILVVSMGITAVLKKWKYTRIFVDL